MRAGYRHAHWKQGMKAAREGYAETILPAVTAKHADLIAAGAPEDLLAGWAKGIVMITELTAEADAILADHGARGDRVGDSLQGAGRDRRRLRPPGHQPDLTSRVAASVLSQAPAAAQEARPEPGRKGNAVDLMRAFTVMLGSLHAVDADAEQVNGILVWRDYVHTAVKAGEGLPCTRGRSVYMPSSEKHAGWKMACEAILEDLAEQASDADALHGEKTAEAERADREAVAADAEAAEAEAQAVREFALASECMAARQFVPAAGHAASAAGHRAAAAEAARRAAEARRRAAKAREVAEKAMKWGIAARDALTFGERLVAPVHAKALRVGEALAQAGGVAGVYDHRDTNAADGAPAGRQMAVRGGAR